jgi:uncharacterized protein YndB with AHSA1/START domain
MTAADRSSFVYVTYIRTTPEKLWQALLDPEFTRQYWFGVAMECAWTKGSPWKMVFADGRTVNTGEILEIDPPRRLVIRWVSEFNPEHKVEGPTRCTFELEPSDRVVKLTITHESDQPESKTIKSVSSFWPLIASNLKSLLETGEVPITEWR